MLAVLLILTMACKNEEMNDIAPAPAPAPDPESPATPEYGLGWIGEDDLSKVPAATNFGFGSGNLPTMVDLTDKFPPIGDQGSYGTCVTWTVAYNIKTAIDGMDRGLSPNDLAAAANQFSPKDLFVAIPDNEKGPNCNGTNFSFALDVLQNRGVATMQTVPYTTLGDCSQSGLQTQWSDEAAQHRIQYWRKIDPSVQSIKQNLANNIPVILGAKLADNFMSWNSDAVLSSSTTTTNVGQHAYHAMVIGGYDDGKGPNGAFRVINSWSERWGDRGYIWVDYEFLVNDFCTSFNGEKPLFIVANDEDSTQPPDDNTPVTSGVDLAPWVLADYTTYWTTGNYTERQIEFNVYNIGDRPAEPAANWSYYYIYFNAFDANDYGVLFYDEFNTAVSPGSFECPASYNCILNYPIPSGGDFASTVFGGTSVSRTYYMPEITGSYYLVLVADAEDVFQEEDELNNLFYTTTDPIWFDGGYAQLSSSEGEVTERSEEMPGLVQAGAPSRRQLQASSHHTIVSPRFPNAYTPQEILSFFDREKASGRLKEKVEAYVQGAKTAVFSQ